MGRAKGAREGSEQKIAPPPQLPHALLLACSLFVAQREQMQHDGKILIAVKKCRELLSKSTVTVASTIRTKLAFPLNILMRYSNLESFLFRQMILSCCGVEKINNATDIGGRNGVGVKPVGCGYCDVHTSG